MKNLGRTAAILFGVVGLSGAGAVLAVGCGGDDTVVSYGSDSGTDSPTADTFVPDTSTTDAGTDSSFHFDAGNPNVAEFFHQIDETGCTWMEACCGGPTQFQVDGPGGCTDTFDNNAATFGFLYTRGLKDTVDGGGNVTFNQASATQCLNLLQNQSCTAPLTSAQSKAIRDACYGAISGNIPAGTAGCQSSIECVPPAHCDTTVNGGTCLAPLSPGAACVGVGNPSDNMGNCGRAYTGTPGTCQAGGLETAAEAGTCAAPLADGTPCLNWFECASNVCDSPPDGGFNLSCVETATYTLPQLNCGFAFVPDGG